MAELRTGLKARERIQRFLEEEFSFYVRSPDRKALRRQCREMARLWRYYGFPPYQYVKHGLYEESFRGDVLDFVPPVLMERFQARMNPPEAVDTVLDKEAFYRTMRAASLPVVELIGSIGRDRRIADAGGRPISLPELIGLAAASGTDALFFKPSAGAQGVGAARMAVRNGHLEWGERKLDEAALAGLLFSGGPCDRFLIQPVIRQCDLLRRMNPASVNTVRIDTLVLDREVASSGAVLRIGCSGTGATDNWAGGGLIVKVDLETGRLDRIAKGKAKFGRQRLEAHPETGFRFDGAALPHWDELRVVVREGALRLRPLRSLGWDVAIADDGPVIVEANQDFDTFLHQEGVGGMRRTPFGEELMRDLRRT